SLNLFQQQEANRRRTVLLVIGFVAFFAWLGFGGDYLFYLYTRDEPSAVYHHVFPWFGIALTVIALLTAWYAYATGPEKVLWSTGARAIVDPTDPQEKQLVNVVEEMAIAAGIPRPRIWIVDDPDPNAFATGTDPLHAHVAVTRGLLVVWIISWILAPIITQLLAVAVSRKREYLADAMSAQFTRNPLALAGALQKIEGAVAPTAAIKRGAAHLCIADPLGRRLTAREGLFADALATHPPMVKRIAVLRGMGYAQLKKEGGGVA